jgi:hypothetical protein
VNEATKQKRRQQLKKFKRIKRASHLPQWLVDWLCNKDWWKRDPADGWHFWLSVSYEQYYQRREKKAKELYAQEMARETGWAGNPKLWSELEEWKKEFWRCEIDN